MRSSLIMAKFTCQRRRRKITGERNTKVSARKSEWPPASRSCFASCFHSTKAHSFSSVCCFASCAANRDEHMRTITAPVPSRFACTTSGPDQSEWSCVGLDHERIPADCLAALAELWAIRVLSCRSPTGGPSKCNPPTPSYKLPGEFTKKNW